MATVDVVTAGNSSYSRPVLDVIDFVAPGAAPLSVVSSDLRISAPGVLAASILGSPNPDRVAIQIIDGLLDARAVAFEEWLERARRHRGDPRHGPRQHDLGQHRRRPD